MNLAYRDVRHNLGRFLLTCLGLGLLLGVVLAMIGVGGAPGEREAHGDEGWGEGERRRAEERHVGS